MLVSSDVRLRPSHSSSHARTPGFAGSWILATFLVIALPGALGIARAQEEGEAAREQAGGAAEAAGAVERDVAYVPTRLEVVDEMLELAGVSAGDTVYDLGSGDGRIVIRAAERYGARGVGIEIDPELVARARAEASEAGVAHLVEFRRADLFEADFSEATVVTLYLLRALNRKLRPRLLGELEPGTPVVSHDYDMGAWEPEEIVDLEADRLYLWRVPEEIPPHLWEDASSGP